MFTHPFFDPSTLSDDDINQKLSALTQRLMVSHWASNSIQMREQLQGMIEALMDERERRLQVQTQEAWDKMFPDKIESDPDFKETKAEKTTEQAAVVKPAGGMKKAFAEPQIFHKEYSKSGAEKKKNEDD